MFFKKKNVISAGASGELIELCDVNDEVFSSKLIGEGYAIKNHNGTIYAPMPGMITTIFPSKHAITIESSSGTEMLIHIGIDTVTLQGEPFEIKKRVGDYIKRGEPIATVDLDYLKSKSIDATIMFIFPDRKEISLIRAPGLVSFDDRIL